MNNTVYDLIIVGAGPAGLSASIYASRYKLNHLIFGMNPGGQITEIRTLENYPGFTSISGRDFISRVLEQMENLGMRINKESVSAIKKEEDVFVVEASGHKYQAHSLILALGTEYKKINIPGEKEFTGRGVSYCATCDAMFFKEKVVSVIGGANSAAVTAMELADHAHKVYVIFRRDKMTADPIWVEKLNNNPKIELIYGTNILEIKGENKVEKIILDKPYDDKTFLKTDGVFVEVGSEPGVSLATNLGVAVDEQKYIIVSPDMGTNISGVFAAGDATTGSNKFRQVITASAEGAIAAASVYKLLKLK
ncbi:MAG TPA: FAD-dependent oxidoreductase [Candidatus Moranbacteria bacterium]|nr:FAD-dependent oxidoreductase [Candidatus Moranbacteria bacterium]